MGLFFIYILKSSVCLAVFYLFHRLLLSRETFHRFNRCVLLGILFLSCFLPLVEVSVKQQTEVHQTVLTLEQLLMLADVAVQTDTVASVTRATVTWVQVVLILYLAGIFFFVCHNLYSLMRLLLLLKAGKREELNTYLPGRDRRICLIVHEQDISPFSWMKYIVISRKDLEENGREILIHECAHIQNRHSWDLLLADFCIFLQWFNPASWLLKRELQNIHEYEADETVLREGVNAKQYQLLLIKKAVGTRLYSMANSFNHSKLKKRITMMLKERSSSWAYLKCLYVLPVAAVAVTAFAHPEVSDKANGLAAVKVNDLAAIVETKVSEIVASADTAKSIKYVSAESDASLKGEVKQVAFNLVEQMPEFPGGMKAMLQYVQDNMQYPAAAKEKGIQGRIVVKFVVEKDGSVVEPEVIRSVDPSLEAEALRLVSSMPKWNPGMQKGQPVRTKFTVPIVFKLGEETKSTASVKTDASPIKENVLVLVDGKEADASALQNINPESIANITVVKNAEQLKEMNAEGKESAIMITLKRPQAAGAVTVEGKVVDEKGEPVVGACILVDGTSAGTVSDREGAFRLVTSSQDASLSVSYIGMQTVKTKAQPQITVTLKAE